MARRRATIKVSGDALRFAAYDHLKTLLFDAPLAVTRPRFDQLEAYIYDRERGAIGKGDPSDLRADMGDRGLPALTQIEWTQAGVALVPIQATFTRDMGPVDSVSGFASYEQTVDLLTAVAHDPRTRGIMLAMDSPGGSAIGTSDAAQAIRALRATVPIRGYVDPSAGSAAVWLLAQCEEIWLPVDGRIGSVGAFMAREDVTQADAAAGRSIVFVSSGDRKLDGNPHHGISAEEIAAMQATVDQMAGMFFAAIAEARGVSVATVAAWQGGTFMGEQAVKAKLADRVGTLSEALAAMDLSLTNGKRGGRVAAHDTGGSIMSTTTAGAPASESNVVSIEDARKQAEAAALAARQAAAGDMVAIGALCDIAAAGNKVKAGELKAEFMTGAFSAADVSAALQRRAVEAQGETEIQGHVSGLAPAPVTAGSKYIDGAPIFAKRAEVRAAAAKAARAQLH